VRQNGTLELEAGRTSGQCQCWRPGCLTSLQLEYLVIRCLDGNPVVWAVGQPHSKTCIHPLVTSTGILLSFPIIFPPNMFFRFSVWALPAFYYTMAYLSRPVT